MSYIEALIFGIVQGITEFLPISSTAHIVITELALGYHFPGLAFEIYLHLASVLAVMLYFRRDLVLIIKGFFSFIIHKDIRDKSNFLFGCYIIVATLITGILGILLKNMVSDFMKTPTFMAVTLTITGAFLIFIEKFHTYGSRTEKQMRWRDAVLVGLGQTVAVLPGISRSGATLITALLLGLSRETAVRYSFLLVIPVILGSSVLAISEINNEMWGLIGTGPLIVAFIASFAFSLIGIIWLIDFLKRSKLIYFAIYLFVLAIGVYLFLDPAVVME